VAKAGVKIVLNKEGTAEAVKKFAPDAVIVAVGSSPFVPDIPGIRGENVLNCREVLSGEREVGKSVIVVGGGHVGCETCFFLAEKGVKVTLTFIEPALDVKFWMFKKYFLDKLQKYNVKVFPQVQYRKITRNGVELTTKGGEVVFLEAENIVLAAGSTPDKALGESLKGKYLDFAEIGDCVQPRRIREAVEEAMWAAVVL
jgi:pyruvate/2-oxoglutarate dehydrogenase complex dihydrolipoamide dehydrogenase (E3) component